MLLAPCSALAAGGPHLVDDSEVEAAGVCLLESWLTRASGDRSQFNAGLGCTPKALPSLELAVFVVHAGSPGPDETLVGLAPKVALRSPERGLGLAMAASLDYGLESDRFENLSLTGIATIPAGERLRLNFNAGLGWSRGGPDGEMFVGTQADLAVGPGISLMTEAFLPEHGKAGAQAGLRWIGGGGSVELDLAAGRYVDGATPTSVSIGVAVRR